MLGTAPAGLGGRGDESVGGGRRTQIHRPERGDAQRRETPRAALRQPSSTASMRASVGSRIRSRHALLRTHFPGLAPRMHTHFVPPSSTPASGCEVLMSTVVIGRSSA